MLANSGPMSDRRCTSPPPCPAHPSAHHCWSPASPVSSPPIPYWTQADSASATAEPPEPSPWSYSRNPLPAMSGSHHGSPAGQPSPSRRDPALLVFPLPTKSHQKPLRANTPYPCCALHDNPLTPIPFDHPRSNIEQINIVIFCPTAVLQDVPVATTAALALLSSSLFLSAAAPPTGS